MPDIPAWFRTVDRTGDVARALSAVIERTAPDGRPWCPPAVGQRIIGLVVNRDLALSSAVHASVRLARLLYAIDGRAYWAPLYRGADAAAAISRLTTAVFRGAIADADRNRAAHAALPRLSSTGVIFSEPELRTRSGDGVVRQGTLAYSEMPACAALLLTLHETLGIDTVARILEPVLTTGRPHRAAFEIGNELSRAFDKWLTDNLVATHQMRKARAIRAQLQTANIRDPAQIDDEVVLGFWEQQARRKEDRVEGFRLFTTSARLLLRYREEMQRQQAAQNVAGPYDIDALAMDRLATDTGFGEHCVDDRQSPLADLQQPPASNIKWLTRSEIQLLSNYLGSGREADHEPAQTDRQRTAASRGAGLAHGQRYDLRLWRTLLRADVFGAIQARLVQQLRDGAGASQTIAAMVAGIPTQNYRDTGETYRAIQKQVQLAQLAALDVLVKAGSPMAATLMIDIGDEHAKREFRALVQTETAATNEDENENDSAVPFEDGRAIERIARAVAAMSTIDPQDGPALWALLDQARKARRSIRRSGFGDGDGDPDLDGFLSAAEPLVRLAAELDRLLTVLDKYLPTAPFDLDRKRFGQVFEALYGDTSETV